MLEPHKVYKIKSTKCVLRKLESIRSHFFNGHDPNCNKASWVNWNMMLAHKDKGGLGVSSLFALNRGLMFKWIWRFYTQDTSLWVRVIKAIYGEAGNMDAKVKAGSTSCWMSIVHEAKSLVNKGIDLFKSRSLVWPFRFKRSPRGGVEQEQFEELVMLVHDVRLVPMSDQWSWTLANSGEFSVASVRQLIDDKTLPEVDYKTRWIKYVPIKVNVLAWKVKSNSLPTRFNVSHRVRLISRWCDISYAEFESYEDWLAWLVNLRLPSKNKLMLEGVFYVMWCTFADVTSLFSAMAQGMARRYPLL
ncbi:hypothetical protein Tco_0697575 [Tanacetum coccineum]